MFSKTARRNKVRKRIRGKVTGTAAKPRLSVFRSNKGIYAQLIDDIAATTLAAASSREAEVDSSLSKTEVAKKVGELIASKAKDAGIEAVTFDRGGYPYHGRVKALAEGAREGGLKF